MKTKNLFKFSIFFLVVTLVDSASFEISLRKTTEIILPAIIPKNIFKRLVENTELDIQTERLSPVTAGGRVL